MRMSVRKFNFYTLTTHYGWINGICITSPFATIIILIYDYTYNYNSTSYDDFGKKARRIGLKANSDSGLSLRGHGPIGKNLRGSYFT